PDPCRNLAWTPPDNATPADQVSYDITLTGPACPTGCVDHTTSPWYTLGPNITAGTYSWTVKANSVTRPSAAAVSGPTLTLGITAPTNLAPSGVTLASDTTMVTLTWTPPAGATQFAVRVRDETDPSLRLPGNNCP